MRSPLRQVSMEEILELQKIEQEREQRGAKERRRMLTSRGFNLEQLDDMF